MSISKKAYARSIFPIFILQSLLLFFFLLSTASAQNPLSIPISGTWPKGTKIKIALDELSADYDVFFNYNHKTVQKNTKQAVSANNLSLGQVLDQMLIKTSIRYEVKGNDIYLKLELRQQVHGRVRDKVTGLPLESAIVQIEGTQLGALSDEQGYFRIENVPVGRVGLRVKYVGYEPYLRKGLEVLMGKETVVNADLTEGILTTEVVVINQGEGDLLPINHHATVSAYRFSFEESKHVAATFGSAARTAMTLPGVSWGSDLNNELIIRGNSARGLQWRIEGVEIPNPNHFAGEGTSSGVLSIISTNLMGDSDFLTGAFPARYGNALSGVFDINIRTGNTRRREYAVQTGSLGTEVLLEGPFRKGGRSSYIVNYRYSSLALLDLLNVRILKDRFTFYQDLGFKFNFPTKKAGTFSIYGISGTSRNGDVPTDSIGFHEYGMIAIGAVNRFVISPKVALVSSFSLSGANVKDRILDSRDYFSEKIKGYYNTSFRVHLKPNPKHNLELGLLGRQLNYNFFERQKDPSRSGIWADFIPFNDEGTAFTIQAYGSWKYRWSPQFSTVLGLHALAHNLVNHSAVEPRLGVAWKLDEKQAVGFGFGMHSRLDNYEYYLVRRPDSVQPNRDLALGRALHLALNYSRKFWKNYHFKAEAYYQYMYNFPGEVREGREFSVVFLNNEGFTYETLENTAQGFNYGIDLSLRKPLIDSSFYLMATASLFDSKYKGHNGILYNSPFNETYNMGFLIGREFTLGRRGRRNLLDINLRGTWRGNRRYTPIDLSISEALGTTFRDNNFSFDRQFDDYLRFDVKISFRQNYSRRTSSILSLDIQNIFDYENTSDNAFSSTDAQRFIRIKNFGILPLISYRIDFGGKTVK